MNCNFYVLVFFVLVVESYTAKKFFKSQLKLFKRVEPLQHTYIPKFTAKELISKHFPQIISNDIDLDPCKSGKNNIT
ncbi:hypothetical protein PGB90_009412 [Kerria lacca]